MKAPINLRGVSLVAIYIFSPADESVGWGEEAEITAIHVAGSPETPEFDISGLLSKNDLAEIEIKCRAHYKAEIRDSFDEPVGDYFQFPVMA